MKNIPKICHMCWTKNSPLSLLQYLSVTSFHKQNPDWAIIIHIPKQEESKLARNTYVPDYKGPDFFPKILELEYVIIHEVDLDKERIGRDKHGILVSDILRVLFLYRSGGLYSDFDMLWLKPMSEFPNIDCIGNASDFETTVCFYLAVEGHHNSSNIVSEPGGEFLRDVLRLQSLVKPPYSHQAFNSELLNKAFPNYWDLVKKYPRILALNYYTFYPYSIYNLGRLYKENDVSAITDKVMGIHWFNGHKLSREYVDENIHSFNTPCSMSSIIKREKLWP